MDDNDLSALKHEIEALAGETLALQWVLVAILTRLGNAAPDIRPLILKAFDDAADEVERISISQGPAAGHTPKALRVIEQLRLTLTGQDKPKHGV